MMKKPVWVGIAIFLALMGIVVYSSMNLTGHRVQACMAFHGQTNCRIASGSTVPFATRTAIQNACAGIASGVTDSMACEQSAPVKIETLK